MIGRWIRKPAKLRSVGPAMEICTLYTSTPDRKSVDLPEKRRFFI